MRVGILMTGWPPPGLVGRYGNYGDMVKVFLTPPDGQAEFIYFDACGGQLPTTAKTCDAYVLTGSASSVYDELDWIARTEAFCLDAHQAGARLLGICFGHQLLARCFGGSVEKAPQGWGVGVHRYRIVEHAPWMDPPQNEISSVALHQDQVSRPPADAKILARSEFCPYAMFSIGHRVLTIQSHPEMTSEYAADLYIARDEVLGKELAAEARDSLAKGTDHDLVGQWARRFLGLLPTNG